jgi:hypothetical protein
VFLLAGLLGLFGIGTLFVTPWVGAPLLAAALLVGILGLVLGGTAAASGEPVEADAVEAPHLPGPDGSESRVD